MQSTTAPAAAATPRQAGVCPVCDTGGAQVVLEMAGVPVHNNLLWTTREGALGAPRGDIRLGFCPTCSHVFNLAFDPALTEYTQAYENSLHFSARFQSYADSLAERLVQRWGLRGKQIVEIGCGKGDFLRQLCRLGGNTGVGFDTSYVPGPEDERDPNVRFVLDFYTERYADVPADMVVCRHVLEHIEEPLAFMRGLRRMIPDGRRPAVYFEMPNALYTLRDMGIWDIIYEHCSYFSPGSLAYVFEAAGFEVVSLTEEFGGQFLGVEALPAEGQARSGGRAWSGFLQMERDVADFGSSYRAKVAQWAETLGRLQAQGRRAVVWGAGSKGVTFMNVFGADSPIDYVVDINPRKHGMYVAGSGQPIVAPELLREYRPDAIIVMNPIYETEIRQFASGLGLSPELLLA